MSVSWQMASGSGRGATALACTDWSSFSPPYRGWDRSIERSVALAARRVEAAAREAQATGRLAALPDEWRSFLRVHVQVCAFMAKATAKVLARASAGCPWPEISRCLHLAALTHDRQAVSLVLHADDLEAVTGISPIEEARARWQEDAAWQGTRQTLARLAEAEDWCETLVAVHLAFEPLVAELLRREYGSLAGVRFDDPVTPAIAEAGRLEYEWAGDWVAALMRHLLADREHGGENRRVLTGWLETWVPQADDAAAGAARLGSAIGLVPDVLLARARAEQRRIVEASGLEVPA